MEKYDNKTLNCQRKSETRSLVSREVTSKLRRNFVFQPVVHSNSELTSSHQLFSCLSKMPQNNSTCLEIPRTHPHTVRDSSVIKGNTDLRPSSPNILSVTNLEN